jgi:hydroxymethylpyrimidine pyrophosphatase-like HAD family hydrolase
MPRISLLLADVDGTLLTEQKSLTERAREDPGDLLL